MNKQQPLYQTAPEILRTDSSIAYLKKIAARTEELDNLYKFGLRCYNEENFEKAFECFDKGYKNVDLRAAYNSAMMLFNGEGVTTNVPEAFKRFKLAAEQGHIGSMRQVGAMLYAGHGIIKDRLQASQWLAKAAEEGDVDAQHDLGVMYLIGDGVDKNPKKALKWLQKAAEKNINAQHIIGTMYLDGDSVVKDIKKGLQLLISAAEEGHMQAQHDLGIIFLEGIYVEKNPKKALEYFDMAAAQGHEEANFFLQKFIIDSEEVVRNNFQQEEAKRRKEINKKIQKSIKDIIKDNLTKSIIPIIKEEVLSRNELQSREAIERGSLLLIPGIEEEFLIRASLEHQEIKERKELSNRKTAEVNRYIKRQLKNLKKIESQARDKILQQQRKAAQQLQLKKLKQIEFQARNEILWQEKKEAQQLQERISETIKKTLITELLKKNIENKETKRRNQLIKEALNETQELINDLLQRLHEKRLIENQRQEIQALRIEAARLKKIEDINLKKDAKDLQEAIGLLKERKLHLLSSMRRRSRYSVSFKGIRLSNEKRKIKHSLLKTINKTFIEHILNKNHNSLRLKDFIQKLYEHIISQNRYPLSEIKERLKAGDIVRKLKLIIEQYPDIFSIKITHNPYDYKDKYVIAFKEEEPSKLSSLCFAPKEEQPPIIFTTTTAITTSSPNLNNQYVNRHTDIAEAKRPVPM